MQSIKKGRKSAPYYLLEKIKDNTNTITGRNLKHIFGHEKIDIFDVNPSLFKKSLTFSQVDKDNIWKINTIKELTNIKKGIMEEKNGGEEKNLGNFGVVKTLTKKLAHCARKCPWVAYFCLFFAEILGGV